MLLPISAGEWVTLAAFYLFTTEDTEGICAAAAMLYI